MENNFDLFKGIENFNLILKKIEEENSEIFKNAEVNYDESCMFFFQDNKISLVEVNEKLPIAMRTHIKNEWGKYCNKN